MKMQEIAHKRDISESVKRKDHDEKVAGRIEYVGDIQPENVLVGKLLRSTLAHGRIKAIHLPPIPEECRIIQASDIPGKNVVTILADDQPIFADQEVQYIGEPILMVVGPTEEQLMQILSQIKVDYEPLPSVLSLEAAIHIGASCVMESYSYGLSEKEMENEINNASRVLKEQFETGYQEHIYLEPQGMIGYWDGKTMLIDGSMQCPYYVKNAVAMALGCQSDAVRIRQTPTGGGFGGKEDFPSMMACQVAVASKVIGTPVRMVFNRREDMSVTTKRHPSHMTYRTCLNKAQEIEAMEIVIYLDGGANLGLSSVVLQRALINATGVYRYNKLRVKGYVMRTNTVPNGAFRGFGAPQSYSGIEAHMGHIADYLDQDGLTFKRKYFVKQGDATSTGGRYRDPILIDTMLEQMLVDIDYKELNKANKRFNQQNKRYKRGLGFSFFAHGCGFTGSGERDHIKAQVRLEKKASDEVIIRIANTEMGQGLLTTMSKIVGDVLEIPYDSIGYPNPDTEIVPDSGPTVASRTTMIVGRLLEQAAIELKQLWQEGKAIEVIKDYEHFEAIPWDEATFHGDAYPAYSWGINMAHVQVDTLTGVTELLDVFGYYDIGKAIDERIIRGQIEGGMTQGLAFGYMERMTSREGAIEQVTISDYAPPTAVDVVPIHSKLFDNPYANGPYGAKGAGELMLVGGAPAVFAAIESAIDKPFSCIPLTPEIIVAGMKTKEKEGTAHESMH